MERHRVCAASSPCLAEGAVAVKRTIQEAYNTIRVLGEVTREQLAAYLGNRFACTLWL